MNEPRKGFQFTLRELILVMILLGAGLGVAIPMLETAREAARRNQCNGHVKMMGLGVLNYESARKRFPLATDSTAGLVAPGTNDPGLSGGGRAQPGNGYSWVVWCLPFSECQTTFDRIKNKTGRLKAEPFSPQNIDPKTGLFLWQFDETDLSFLHCPTFREHVCQGAHSANRYQDAAPVLTNYLAIVGTHFDPQSKPALVQNGVLVGTDAIPGTTCKGITIGQVTDGLSNTIMLCESREATYASWYDGSTAWTLGHPDASVPTTGSDTDHFANAERGLNYGPKSSTAAERFFHANGPYYGLERRWGPSSMHAGGLINVGWADNHAQSLNAREVDPKVWLQIISRDDGTLVDHSAL